MNQTSFHLQNLLILVSLRPTTNFRKQHMLRHGKTSRNRVWVNLYLLSTSSPSTLLLILSRVLRCRRCTPTFWLLSFWPTWIRRLPCWRFGCSRLFSSDWPGSCSHISKHVWKLQFLHTIKTKCTLLPSHPSTTYIYLFSLSTGVGGGQTSGSLVGTSYPPAPPKWRGVGSFLKLFRVLFISFTCSYSCASSWRI